MTIKPTPTTPAELTVALSQYHVDFAKLCQDLVKSENQYELAKAELKNLEAKANIKVRSSLGKVTVDAVEAAVRSDTEVLEVQKKLENLNATKAECRMNVEILQSSFRSMELMAALLGFRK